MSDETTTGDWDGAEEFARLADDPHIMPGYPGDNWEDYYAVLTEHYSVEILTTDHDVVGGYWDVQYEFPSPDDAHRFWSFACRHLRAPDHAIDCYGGTDPRVAFTVRPDDYRDFCDALVANHATDTSDDSDDADATDDGDGRYRLKSVKDIELTVPTFEVEDGRLVVKDPDDEEAVEEAVEDAKEAGADGPVTEAVEEALGDADPETCPDCGSAHTVGFSTGDRVCKECNHNYDPE